MGSMDNGGPYGAPQDALTLWKFTADFVTPVNSTFVLANTIPISSYDTMPAFCSGRACIPQPGTANKIDHLGYRQRPLHRLAYRNFGTHESLVTNQSVEASTTMSGIRWWEVRSPNSNPVLYQDSTYAPGLQDGIHRWMGSIAMDKNGNMALGYSASNGTTTFPSSWYTGRLATDPPNTMPQGEGSIINGTGSQTSSNRWGDYTSMNIDPADDCTFWYVNQWIPTSSASGWRLRIGSFRFPNCGGGNPTPTPTNPPPTATPTPTNPPPTATPTPTNPPPTATPTATPPPQRCAAGYHEVTLVTEGFEGSFPPAGWAVSNTTTGCGAPGVPDWTNTDPGANGNLTGGTGLFATADSDACGSGSVMNAQMWSPVLNLTNYTSPVVSYYTDYNDLATGGDMAYLDFSTDGGSTWANLLTWDQDHRGPLLVQQPFAGDGQASTVVR